MERSTGPLPEKTTGATGTAAAPAKEPERDFAAREERVAELQQQVQAGTYKVDAAKLSAKIIEHDLKR